MASTRYILYLFVPRVCVCVWMCHGLRKLGNSVSKVEFRERGKPASWGSLVWSNLDVTLFSLELR